MSQCCSYWGPVRYWGHWHICLTSLNPLWPGWNYPNFQATFTRNFHRKTMCSYSIKCVPLVQLRSFSIGASISKRRTGKKNHHRAGVYFYIRYFVKRYGYVPSLGISVKLVLIAIGSGRSLCIAIEKFYKLIVTISFQLALYWHRYIKYHDRVFLTSPKTHLQCWHISKLSYECQWSKNQGCFLYRSQPGKYMARG